MLSKAVRIHSADGVSVPSVEARRVSVEYQTSDDSARIGQGRDFLLKAGRQPNMKHLLTSKCDLSRALLELKKNLNQDECHTKFDSFNLCTYNNGQSTGSKQNRCAK